MSATSRCCAPSCRSRSIRRRSASAAAMMRARASEVVDALAQLDGARAEHDAGADADSQARPLNRCRQSRHSRTPTGTAAIAATGLSISQPKKITGVNATISGANASTSEVKPSSDDRRERGDAERELAEHEDEPLPRHRVAQPQRHALAPAEVAPALDRRVDGDPQQPAGEHALDRRHRAQGEQRGEQDREADQDHREAGADGQPGDEHDEVRDPEREREHQVEQVQLGLRLPGDAGEPRQGRAR